jgi:predicted ATPase
MAMDVDSIRKVFTAQGYTRTRDTKKRDEYQAPVIGHYLYFSKERDLTSSLQIVIHPHLKLEPFLDLSGVSCPKPDEFHHGSNMRQFPKRKNHGEEEIHYGRALKIDSLEALTRFLQFFDTPAGSQRENDNLPPRLTAIELENFKGVGKRVRIELAPITLLFGANSAGKSTILQALQYVREILERRNANPDRTLHGGDFIDLGGFRNLVHQRDMLRRIDVKLEMTLNSKDLPDLMPEPWEEWQSDDERLYELYTLLSGCQQRMDKIGVTLTIGWNSSRQKAVVLKYEIEVSGNWLGRIESAEDGRDVRIALNPKNPLFIRYRTDEEIEEQRKISAELGLEDPIELIEPIMDQDENHDDRAYSIHDELLSLLEELGVERKDNGLRSWLTDFDGALPRLETALDPGVRGGLGAAGIYAAREFTAFLSRIFIGPGVLIRDRLRKLRYLGPIRNVPDRNFSAALTLDEARWADGTAAWETLLSGDATLIEEVSKWMSDKERLATGYEIERRGFKEIDIGTLNWLIRAADPDAGTRSDPELLRELETAPEKWRLDLIDAQTGMRIQPRDVGIGISQVLPVVVAALEPSAALVAIEQPELHIHPAVQVGLGDLLIKATKERGTNFLIETHSEHLILRLLRRIRETTEGELPLEGIPLKPGEVAVVYVQSGKTGVEMVPLPIDETGEFTKRWPKGFFDERAEELF